MQGIGQTYPVNLLLPGLIKLQTSYLEGHAWRANMMTSLRKTYIQESMTQIRSFPCVVRGPFAWRLPAQNDGHDDITIKLSTYEGSPGLDPVPCGHTLNKVLLIHFHEIHRLGASRACKNSIWSCSPVSVTDCL